MQSTESETRKQIERELILQDALQEIFEPENPCIEVAEDLYGKNPCGEIPLPKPTEKILKKYGVDSKQELFKLLMQIRVNMKVND